MASNFDPNYLVLNTHASVFRLLSIDGPIQLCALWMDPNLLSLTFYISHLPYWVHRQPCKLINSFFVTSVRNPT